MSQPALTTLNMQRSARQLELTYNDGSVYQLSYEFLRVHSPSAEVKGHGHGQEVLQTGKKEVMLLSIEAIGNYAVRLFFDDKHDSGIYSWDYLYELATHKDSYWENYLQRLALANKSRENPQKVKLQVVQSFDPSQKPH
jgi:DUF971 family protein